MMRIWTAICFCPLTIIVSLGFCDLPVQAQIQGQLVDVSQDFNELAAVHFVPNELVEFNKDTGAGKINWHRYQKSANLSFNKIDVAYARADSNEFPSTEYDRDPTLEFSLEFVSPRAVRLRFATRSEPLSDGQSLMLDGPVESDSSWNVEESDEEIVYTNASGSVHIRKSPWQIEFRDPAGKLLTRTRTLNDPDTFSAPTPFSFVRRARDLGHSTAASFTLSHDEKIFGCGESFTRFDKRGQKVLLYLRDAMGAQSQRMYKPIPFFMSDRGYGMFTHTSTPIAYDFGQDFDEANVIYTGDEELDLFVFFGNPGEVLTEYTAITGRSPVPPLWSFGLWMSRITYKSEQEVREVAAKLREYRIPCDVIHLDTGWFETDWQCNYQFAPSRFENPQQMIADLKDDGFRVSLWQLPYFTRKNELFETIAENGYAVKSTGGRSPYIDGVLDFSNEQTQSWYEGLIEGLLEQGVSAIKVDFGEDAPLQGLYASGRSGWYEHNLYPLRYNKTVAELTKQTTGENIIWARSAWAGSQRYPLHWGGDAENTDSAMAATLRAGMSLGLCGFTYWSHDAGGFVAKPTEDLYRRWLAFSMLTSHTRCHGAFPREPWAYGEEFVEDFRQMAELRYSLIPYLYTQAKEASELGHPLLRPLFFEFPEDHTVWNIDDQYMLGKDLLVAPYFSQASERLVYLPPGGWFDYQTGERYQGGGWITLPLDEIPVVLLVRDGAVVPHVNVAQSTDEIDWDVLELRTYGEPQENPIVKLVKPDGSILSVQLTKQDGALQLPHELAHDQKEWTVSRFDAKLASSEKQSRASAK